MTITRTRVLPELLLVLALLAAPVAQAGTATVGMGGVFRVPVASYSELPFTTVVRQQYDYSCGSAALATLLRFHYGRETGETEVFQAMYEVGDKTRIQEIGFSLLDMKLYLEKLGYRADGFRITLDNLAKVKIPAIALIEPDGYRHFVVIKGIREGVVLVGDPAKGLRSYPIAEFERIRVDDIVFVIRDQAQAARASFDRDRDWQLKRPGAPLGRALSRRTLADHGALARIPAQFRFVERVNVR